MSEQLTIEHTSIDSATERNVRRGKSRMDTVLEQLSVGAQRGVSVWAQYDRQRSRETVGRNTIR